MSAIDYSKLTNTLNLAKKALEFYANRSNYHGGMGNASLIDLDHHGHQARYAIETIDLILNPDYNAEKVMAYERAILAQQQADIEESFKNMTIMADDTKNQYDKLLKSGMFFELHPELEGNWEADKDEFIKKLYE